MEKIIPRYRRILGGIFLLWLFLWIDKKFGFDFRIDLLVFFKFFLLLLLVLIAVEIKMGWKEIAPFLEDILWGAEGKFSAETKRIQEEITAFLPRIFTTRLGSLFALFSAATFLFLRTCFQVFREFVLSKNAVFFLGITGILLDVFVFDFTSDFVILLLTGLWIWSIWLYKFEGRISAGVALIFLLICPFLLILRKESIAEKAAIWAYMFLLVGVGQMFIEYLKENRY